MLKVFHFDGCGAAFPYLVGYALYLKRNLLLDPSVHFSGVSSGGLIAMLMAVEGDLLHSVELAYRYQQRARLRPWGLLGIWRSILIRYYEQLMPDDFDYAGLSRLHLRVTYADLRTEFITQFHDKRELIECLLASQHIPFFLDYRPFARFRGRRCLDGQWLSRQTPLAGLANVFVISPLRWHPFKEPVGLLDVVTIKSPQKIDALIQKGYADAQQALPRLLQLGLSHCRIDRQDNLPSQGPSHAASGLRVHLLAPPSAHPDRA